MIRKYKYTIIFSLVALVLSNPLFAQSELPEPAEETGVAMESSIGEAMDTENLVVEPESIEVVQHSMLSGVDKNPEVLALLWTADPGVGSIALENIEFSALVTLVQAAVSDSPVTEIDTAVLEADIPSGVLNNPYYLESLRYKALAEDAFEYGDYDAAANYAAESLKNAQLSNDYIALQLLIKSATDNLTRAKTRLEWAASIGAEKTYPTQYSSAQTYYTEAETAYRAERWQDSIEASRQVLDALANVQQLAPLPSRYTVRPWAQTRDCFWNISGYSFVYGDPTKWRVLYDRNKTKLRQPDNPNLIHPGLVLEIPSLFGEVRDGMWVPGRAYAPLPKAK
ncbi:MAG: hypothetical protein SNJ56_01735 [Termitinemataceae bacterium]